MYDFIIIGAGVTGANIARELSKYELEVLLLEKENDVANHATIANSAIIHSGHDPKENSLKARLCVRGNKLYDQLEKDLNIPLLRNGALVVAYSAEELEILYTLYERAQKNGVEVKFLTAEEAYNLEPNLNDDLMKALSLPTTKVTYPWEVAIACIENAVENGVTLKKNQAVKSIKKEDNNFIVKTETDTFKARYVINAAGVFSENIAHMVENNVEYKMTPRRGEYFVLDRRVKGFVNHTIYPIPSSKGKGVLLTPQVHGNILVGPNSEFQDEKDNVSSTKDGLTYVKIESSRLVKNIPFNRVIRTFTGVRATINQKDFYIQESKEVPNFIHAAGIDSPGLTASPAIAEYIVNEIIKPKETLNPKSDYNPNRVYIKLFSEMNDEEKKRAYHEDHRYGRLVCKCEKITEGDIVKAIHRSVGADSIKGIKKRARAGSGLCQGGYCEHQVMKIIARELDMPLEEVDYYQKGTPLLYKETKVKQ